MVTTSPTRASHGVPGSPPPPGPQGARCPPVALTAALLVGAVGTGVGEVAGQLCLDAAPAVTGHLPSRAEAGTHPARQRGQEMPWWRKAPGWSAVLRGPGGSSSATPLSHGPPSLSTSLDTSLALHSPSPSPTLPWLLPPGEGTKGLGKSVTV